MKLLAMLLFAGGWKKPKMLLRTLNFTKFGRTAMSLYLAYAALPFVREKPYDILHCQFGFSGPLALSLKQVKAFNGKLVISFRGVDITQNLISNPKIYDNIFREADCLLPVSKNFKQKLIKEGCDPAKIKVHYSGIDTTRFKYTERNRNLEDITQIYSIGRLVEKKGFAYGIKAIALSVASGHKVNYTIIGDGPLREKLQNLISLLNLEKYITLAGWMTRDEIIHKLDDAHLLLTPSITSKSGDCEGVPNASKEAMALGIPVLSTYHSGIPELIEDGVSGFLVPERDVNALAHKLDFLIDNPGIWPQISRSGREVIETKFEINKLNNELLDTYRELLNNSNSRVSIKTLNRRQRKSKEVEENLKFSLKLD
ncbi:MAG: glycosyltransferase [Balneolales bacterium]